MGGQFSPAVYIIGRQTKAILTNDSAYYRSHILEIDQELDSVHSPEQIIDHSCILYGSTLTGRRESAKKLLNVNSKVPVPVIRDEGIFMLPTSSSNNKDNVWLSYYHINTFEQHNGQTYVTFHDRSGLFVNTSVTIFDMQVKRTSELIARLNRSLFFGNGPFNWSRFK